MCRRQHGDGAAGDGLYAGLYTRVNQAIVAQPKPERGVEQPPPALDEGAYRVHLLAFEDNAGVRATEITNLDPVAEDEREAGWGGLTGYSSRFGDAVREAVNASAK